MEIEEEPGMEIPKTGSLISSDIAKYYEENEDIIDNGAMINYYMADNTFDWHNLEHLLFAGPELSSDKSLANDLSFPKTYDEYMRYFKLIQPILQASPAVLSRAIRNRHDETGFCDLFQRLQCHGQQDQLPTIVREHLRPTFETSVVENILFLTAMIERALGNLYYTIAKKTPPHLLRDLLDTEELRCFLGICPVLFFKIIMGSPESVNLRNIVWHGFPHPTEIPAYYVSTLLIVGASISVLIDEQRCELDSRPIITDFNRFVFKIKASSIDFTVLSDIPQMISAIENCRWIGPTQHKAFWYRIVQHYENGNYWQCAILILPQIELILRRIYGENNDFDISAKLGEYYVTMNTIFMTKDDMFYNCNNDTGTARLLYDVFTSPYGMRIRDKVSHGEVDLKCIHKDLCLILLYAGLNLITSNEVYPLDHYNSRFTIRYITYDALAKSLKGIQDLMALQTPSSYEIEYNWDEECIADLQALTLVRPDQIFNRFKKELVLLSLNKEIATHVVHICRNYTFAFGEFFQMLENRELRSRARNTLRKMVEAMRVIGGTLGNIVQFAVQLNNLMQTECSHWFEQAFERNLRFCKQTLSIVENIQKFSCTISNEWVNALDCCDRYQKLSNEFIDLQREIIRELEKGLKIDDRDGRVCVLHPKKHVRIKSS